MKVAGGPKLHTCSVGSLNSSPYDHAMVLTHPEAMGGPMGNPLSGPVGAEKRSHKRSYVRDRRGHANNPVTFLSLGKKTRDRALRLRQLNHRLNRL
jgi:hypothetical protein